MRYLIFIILSTSVQALASTDFNSYEDIVKELEGNRGRSSTQFGSSIDTVRIHASLGMVSSRVALDVPKGLPQSKALEGAEVIVGIDLFTPRWIAEGAMRTYNDSEYASTRIRLREFDLRLVHEILFQPLTTLRWGSGLSARYLKFDSPIVTENQTINSDYSTPAWLFLVGARAHVHKQMSVGAELVYRSSLISESIEVSSIDGTIRLTGTF